MRIYPDTNIWNRLCLQAVDEQKLVQSLASRHSTLVLSAHAVYEMARTFSGTAGDARGIQLFSCIARFLDFGVPCWKEVMEFLKDECYAFENSLPEIDPLLSDDELDIVRTEVRKLAAGIVEGRVKEFIDRRTQFAADTRAEQREHFTTRPDLQETLRKVKEVDLQPWLARETMTSQGANVLCSHLTRMLGAGPTTEYAAAVLRGPASHAARALVRADLYSNWRAANRGSNPPDLIDDVLHALQATYSDVYLTADVKHAKYASLVLTPNTQVALYDGATPIADWIETLAYADETAELRSLAVERGPCGRA
jgi:hypothetical protein